MSDGSEYENLTSLMKTKFGVTKSSPLKLTEKDTLFTAFRKLADNIYKNGEWTTEDDMKAVDTMMRNYFAKGVGLKELSYTPMGSKNSLPMSIEVSPITDEEKSDLGTRVGTQVGYTAAVTREKNDGSPDVQKTFVLLDPDNKKGTKHNTHYYFETIQQYQKNSDQENRVYYAIGNRNRAIGYDKLQRDMLNEFDNQVVTGKLSGLERSDLDAYLRKLVNPDYAGKKYREVFQKNLFGEFTDEFLDSLPRDEGTKYWEIPPSEEDVRQGRKPFNYRDLTEYPDSKNKLNLDEAPYLLERQTEHGHATRYIYPKDVEKYRKHNKLIDFVHSYIEDTYDIILQCEYEKDIEKQVRAGAWQTKKNINKETQELMNQTSLKNQFGFVEIDNDVDLSLFHTFEAEMNRVIEVLPKTKAVADLRLRKLGNYHALGLFHPPSQTIAIDFRDYGDDISGVGIQSFVHEYGHFIDYTVGDKLLSIQDDFRPFVAQYRENISTLSPDSFVSNKRAYYGTPTEVFARAFEVYVSEAGLDSIFLQPMEVYQNDDAYKIITMEMREELSKYFDQQFPELKQKIIELKGEIEMGSSKPKQENNREEVELSEPIESDYIEKERTHDLEYEKALVSLQESLNALENPELAAQISASYDLSDFEDVKLLKKLVDERLSDLGKEVPIVNEQSEQVETDYEENQESLFENLISTYPGEVVQEMKNNMGIENNQVNVGKVESEVSNQDLSQNVEEFSEKQENLTENHTLEDSLSFERSLNDTEPNTQGDSLEEENLDRYVQVEFNESNPSEGVKRYQGEIVTPEFLSSLLEMDSRLVQEKGSYKFSFDEIVNGEVVANHRMNIGDGPEANQEVADLFKELAVSQKKAAAIRPSHSMVVGGESSSEPKNSVEAEPVYSVDDLISDINKLTPREAEALTQRSKKRIQQQIAELQERQQLPPEKSTEYIQEAEQLKFHELKGNIDLEQPVVNEPAKAMIDKSIVAKLMQSSQSIFPNEFKRALDDAFSVMENKPEGTNEYLTKYEIDKILDDHLTKIEKIISSYATSGQFMQNQTTEQKAGFLKNMFENIKSEVIQFKNKLLFTLSNKKDKVIFNVREKTETLRIEVKNSINYRRIDKAYKKMQSLADKLENKYIIEEKIDRAKIESKAVEEQINEVEAKSVEQLEKSVEEQIEPLKAEVEIDQVSTENNLTKNNLLTKVENLSVRLNLVISEEEKKEIEGLSSEEQAALVQHMEKALSENAKNIELEEQEIEVG